MSKRHYRRGARRAMGGLIGKGSLMSGIVKPKGMIGNAVTGIGAAAIANELLGGEKFPYQSEAIGFITGGIAGGIGVFALKNMNLAINRAPSASLY